VRKSQVRGGQFMATQSGSAGARVHLSLFNLIIEVESDAIYPDQMHDMTNRALGLFEGALEICKVNNLDIRSDDLDDYIEEEDV